MRMTAWTTLALLWAVFLLFSSPIKVDAFTPCCRRGGGGGRATSRSRLFGDGNPPSFAEYYAARQQQQQQSPPSASPPPPPQQQQQQTAPTAGAGFYSSNSNDNDDGRAVMADLQAAQRQDIMGLVKSRLSDLVIRPQLSNDMVQGYDAPGSGANIAWLADVMIPNRLVSITVFHGPLTDVPHIVDRVILSSPQFLTWTVDVRPRAYGAYETLDRTTGLYPGPETLGRKAFEYAGNRKQFTTKFGNTIQPLLTDWSQEFAGAVVLPPRNDIGEAAVLTTGPLAVTVQMPATASNGRALARRRRALHETWLNWTTNERELHAHRPGAPINAQYVYDAKYRQNAYLAMLEEYGRFLSPSHDADQVKALVIAESGPLDEAYVGGGS
jgi:hypothetical protein